MRAAKLAKLKTPFAIAVSGGGDSMALLRLALEVHGAAGFVALTVDHALRKSSAAEARKVKAWCKVLGIEHHILNWRHSGINSGLQAKARKARYDMMTKWCVTHGVAQLLTAHTADDQAETVAMRMKRTSSAKSLAGIWPQTEWNGVRVLRPLLSKRRAALRGYLVAVDQQWIEDESNSNEKYERVRIRNSAPLIALAAQATHSQKQIEKAQQQAEAWIARELMVSQAGMLTFAISTFAKLGELSGDDVLQKIIHLCGGTPPELAKRKALLTWMSADESPKRTLGGVTFEKHQGTIRAAREAARIAAAPIKTISSQPVIWDNRFKVCAPKGSTILAKARLKSMKRNDEIPHFVDQSLPVVMLPGKIAIDALASPSPLVTATFIKK